MKLFSSFGFWFLVIYGVPKTITDAKGTKLTQTVDSSGRITGTGISNTVNVGYTYGNGNLTKIARVDDKTDRTNNYVFGYDSFGNMTSAKVGSTTYDYYYASGKLLRMEVSDGTVMDFFYDHVGAPYAVRYNGTMYYYVLNLQGDVVRIVNSSGATTGTYKYDAWGNILSQTNHAVVNANPLRYRGYCYDAEVGL